MNAIHQALARFQQKALGKPLSKQQHIISVETNVRTRLDCDIEEEEEQACIEVSLSSLADDGNNKNKATDPPTPEKRNRRPTRNTTPPLGFTVSLLSKRKSKKKERPLESEEEGSFSINTPVNTTFSSEYEDSESFLTEGATSSSGPSRAVQSRHTQYTSSCSGSGSTLSTGNQTPPPTMILPRTRYGHTRHNTPDSVVSILKPFAGSSTREVKNFAPRRSNLHDERRFFEKDLSYEDSEQTDHVRNALQWRTISGSSLKVRSDTYQSNRKKEPSIGELYECLRVDILESPHRLPHMSNRVELPEPDEDEGDDCYVTWDAPDIFVVTLSIPLETKGNTEQKPCLTISIYFGIRPETKEILKHITASPKDKKEDEDSFRRRIGEESYAKINAIRLFDQWCRQSPDDPIFQGRFKIIPHLANIDELGIPSWISRWNGKPVLIKRTGKTGFLYSGKTPDEATVMEMEVSFHPFPWAAKQAIEYLREQIFHKVLLSLGFVIEAREGELPEVLIGLTQLCYPEASKAVSSRDFFFQS